jgi:hypothetical protein
MDYRYSGFRVVHVPNFWGKNRFVVPSMVHRDFMAALVQPGDDVWSDEVRPTDHRYSHAGKSLPL